MASSRKAAGPHANRLLGLLTPADYARLQPHLRPIELEYRQSLYRAHAPIRFVYFIETGVGSLVNTMANGDASEVGTIGNEGVVGLPVLLGDNRAPTSVYVQVPGAGLRMKVTLFKEELAQSASMQAVMLHYAHGFFNQVAQSAACNQFHSIEQRCCRWLLRTHDRMQSDDFFGLIRYKRGNVSVLDRQGLERRSCECCSISKREFDRLLSDRPRRRVRSSSPGSAKLNR